MTKNEFQNFRKNCPWNYREKGEPKCLAQDARISITRHCSKKNCAVIYWVYKLLKKEGLK